MKTRCMYRVIEKKPRTNKEKTYESMWYGSAQNITVLHETLTKQFPQKHYEIEFVKMTSYETSKI